MGRLQGCNPFTLTNTSGVKPASRPETPANDAFELLKPQTINPNNTTPGGPFKWAPRSRDSYPDRRFDLRKNSPTSTTNDYGQREDRPTRGRKDYGQMVSSLGF